MVALGLRENGSRIKVDSVVIVVSTEVITMVELGLRQRVLKDLKVGGTTAMQALILVGEAGGNIKPC